MRRRPGQGTRVGREHQRLIKEAMSKDSLDDADQVSLFRALVGGLQIHLNLAP